MATGDHAYTSSEAERDFALITYGYIDEGVACHIFRTQVAGTTALLRMLHPGTGDHFYTTSNSEAQTAVNVHGYVVEGAPGFVHTSAVAGTVPFWRRWHPGINDHFYTVSRPEADNAVNALGYVDEGIACFVAPAPGPGTVPLLRIVKVADILVPMRVVRMANDDGSNLAQLSAAQLTRWVDTVNRAYTPSRIGLTVDLAADYIIRRGTRLNELWEGSGEERDVHGITDANAVAQETPRRLVVIVRTSRPISPTPPGGCGPGCGSSWWTLRYVLMPPFSASQIELLAHEVGHYLGLPHTHRFVLDTVNDAGVVMSVGGGAGVFDNDYGYVGDTPPDPFIREIDATGQTSVTLNGVALPLPRNNTMSYWSAPSPKAITAGQAMRMIDILRSRRAAGLAVQGDLSVRVVAS